MDNATPRLAARDITVRFGGLVANSEVSIDVAAGEIVGLVGPNGAGKSTLFGVLSGLLRPTQGSVWMDGVDITHASPQKRSALGLARTFQHPELFHGLTVREHLVLANRLLHQHRRVYSDVLTFAGLRPGSSAEAKRIGDLMDLLGLTPIADRPVLGLPLGQARLVEIGRAMARGPKVILFDEGSSGLDAQETEQLIPVLRRTAEARGVSLLLIEHDVELVLGLCERVFVLDFGKVIAAGHPDEIRGNDVVRAAYLGTETSTLDHLAEEVAAASPSNGGDVS